MPWLSGLALARSLHSNGTKCREAGSTAAVSARIDKAPHTADVGLRGLAARLRRVLPPIEQRALAVAERAWIQYRDAE